MTAQDEALNAIERREREADAGAAVARAAPFHDAGDVRLGVEPEAELGRLRGVERDRRGAGVLHAAEIDRESDRFSARSEALEECLKKLPENQRRLVLLRYYEDHDITSIAKETDRSEAAVYKLLSRVRAALNECVTARLNAPAT